MVQLVFSRGMFVFKAENPSSRQSIFGAKYAPQSYFVTPELPALLGSWYNVGDAPYPTTLARHGGLLGC